MLSLYCKIPTSLPRGIAVDAPMSPNEPFPPETTGPAPPQRPNAGTGDDYGIDGVACTALCSYFPRFSRKPRPVKLRKSTRKAEAPIARRVTSWWPWSPSHAAAAGSSTSDDDDGSASLKHWGRSQSRSQSSRVTPRDSSSSSFSFPSSPACTSSFMSTPKLGQGS